MSLRNTLIVLALLLVVGGYALYLNHQPPPETKPKLFTLDPKDISTIELKSSDRDIVLERTSGAEWKITKPVKAAAEGYAIEAIAKQITDAEVTGTADDHPNDLAPFGLAIPAVTVIITTKDHKTLPAVMVGKTAPIGSSAFIKIADNPAVQMTASSFAAEVNKHVNDLRSRNLFNALKPPQAEKIVIANAGTTLELDRARGGSQWSIVKPRSYPADNDAVTKFLSLLDNARATRFIDDQKPDLPKYGLATPSLAITLYGPHDTARQAVRFGFKEPEANATGTYARTGDAPDDPVYTVSNDILTSANKGFDDLRDKTVLRFDPASVARVTIAGGPIQETLDRGADDKWTVSSEGKSAAAELPVATSLLDQLHSLTAKRIVEDTMSDPKRYGMVTPTLTISLQDKDGKPVADFRASILEVTVNPHTSDEKPQKQSFGYATTSLDGTVYEIAPADVTNLENTANRLHSDVVPTPAPTASHSATVTATPSPAPTASPSAPKAAP